MRIPKRYGQSKVNRCPFCNVQASFQNPQGVPVCRRHKNVNLDDLKCVCGEYLETMKGKFGSYFRCVNCGNMNFRKGIEMNEDRIRRMKEPELKRKKKFEEIKSKAEKKKTGPGETVVTSDELDFMFD